MSETLRSVCTINVFNFINLLIKVNGLFKEFMKRPDPPCLGGKSLPFHNNRGKDPYSVTVKFWENCMIFKELYIRVEPVKSSYYLNKKKTKNVLGFLCHYKKKIYFGFGVKE